MTDRTCTDEGCNARHYAKGLCQKHYNAAYYARNSDTVRERARSWAVENPDRKRANDHAWADANADRKRTNDAAQKARKREHYRDLHRAAYLADPERAKERWRRRRALKRANGYEPVSYVAILNEHGMICHICGDAIATREDLHFDHVIPLSKGGSHTASNIRPAHALCNWRKGTRILD